MTQPARSRRAPWPFIPFSYLETGEAFRFPASDDVNTKLERYGWYQQPDGLTRSVDRTTMVLRVLDVPRRT